MTAAKEIFRDCLANTHAESATGTHPGSVEITKGGGTLQALDFKQGSLTSCLGSAANGNWKSISDSFNGNLRAHVPPLNLTITLLGNGTTQPVDLIRRPVRGEDATNAGVTGLRAWDGSGWDAKTLDALGVRPDSSYRELEPGLRQALVVGRPIAGS